MQLIRQTEKNGIAHSRLNQRMFALKTKAANVRSQHGKAQQGGSAAAAQFGHKGGGRACRAKPLLLQVFVWRALVWRVFVRRALVWPMLFRWQATRGESGQ